MLQKNFGAFALAEINPYPPEILCNMLRVPPVLFVVFLLACESNSEHTTAGREGTPEVDTLSVAETGGMSSKKAATWNHKTPAAPELGGDFPEDQMVKLTPDHLSALCGNKYGCLMEVLYPLGWSSDGKFAFFVKEASEAVQNTVIHLRIQDMTNDALLEQHTFKASEQPGWDEEMDSHSLLGVWQSQKPLYDSLLRQHRIQLGKGTVFSPVNALEAYYAIRLTSRDKMRYNSLFDIQEVDQHQLLVRKGQKRKVVCEQTMGKYDVVIKSQPLGGFESPFEKRIAILDGLEKRGYEGPPNVLRLQLIGCDLNEGLE